MNKDQIVSVVNRSSGQVIYRIPELGIRRTFAPNEKKDITVGEIEKLTYQAGGTALLREYLQVLNPQTTADFNIHTEAEYWMTKDQVIELLKTGSLDALKDALDFAPQGVKDLIKEWAVKLPLNDVAKREAIKEQLKFDVTAAIENMKEDAPVQAAAKPERRVQPAKEEPEAPQRRTSGEAYKIGTATKSE